MVLAAALWAGVVFAQETTPQPDPVKQAVMDKCSKVGLKEFQSFSGPPLAKAPYAKAFTDACLIHLYPGDRTDPAFQAELASVKKMEKDALAEARIFVPSLPDPEPLWSKLLDDPH